MASPRHNIDSVVPVEQILKHSEYSPDDLERIAFRKIKGPALAILEPDPEWHKYFEEIKSRILTAFAETSPAHDEGSNDNTVPTILAINHVGSTSIPNLPAKAVIDIDLVLTSLSAESYYVPRLESAGFQFLFREPLWHGHRFFVAHEPISCNLHVFGPGCPEVERHSIFSDYLRKHEEERELYAQTKREAAAAARERGEDMDGYNKRKEGVVRGILERAFRELGYL